ncbi:hypothetical protein EDB89DRAFT_443395 [Lactarius sanguifluus]|nr:hypothetical protein EDB89DRAFT_443395 [Lactarius sanguifluus]
MTVLDSEHSILSEDEDDMPLASQSHNGKMKNGHVSMNGAASGKGRVLDADGDTPMSDPDDDDVPLVTRSDTLTPSKRKRRAAPVSDFSDDDDKPLALTSSPPKHRHPTVTPKIGSRKATTLPASTSGTNGKVKAEESDSDDTPLNSHLASSSKKTISNLRTTNPLRPRRSPNRKRSGRLRKVMQTNNLSRRLRRGK